MCCFCYQERHVLFVRDFACHVGEFPVVAVKVVASPVRQCCRDDGGIIIKTDDILSCATKMSHISTKTAMTVIVEGMMLTM